MNTNGNECSMKGLGLWLCSFSLHQAGVALLSERCPGHGIRRDEKNFFFKSEEEKLLVSVLKLN